MGVLVDMEKTEAIIGLKSSGEVLPLKVRFIFRRTDSICQAKSGSVPR